MLAFVLKAVKACLDSGTFFFVENPGGSWLWKQIRALSWGRLLAGGSISDFRAEYCRFGTPWRKRAKFSANLLIGGQRPLCNCHHRHLQLRGRCKENGSANFGGPGQNIAP